MSNSIKRFIILALVFAYIVSPIDLMPGMVLDDLIVAIVAIMQLPSRTTDV